MKIRQGFVSNSSSSSFLVFSKKINIREIVDKKLPKDKYYLYREGSSYGVDFFPITSDMLKIIKENLGKIAEWSVCEVFCKQPEEDVDREYIISLIRKLPKSFRIRTIEIDNYITKNAKDFKERYIDLA